MPRWPGFIGGSAPAQALLSDVEDTVNLYVETAQSESAKSPKALYPTPGFTAFTVGIPDVGSRGCKVVKGRVFFVIATGFYEVFADGTWTKRGIVAQDTNLATISDNGVGQLLLTSGGNGYCYVLATNTLTQVLAGDATMGAFASGRFLALNVGTGIVRVSELNDGLTWDPTRTLIRSQQPDPWQALFVDPQGLVWLPGTETFEVWYTTQNANQPYAPLSGLVGPYGIAAPFAWAQAAGQILWVASTKDGAGSIISAQGGGHAVSTYAVDTAIAGYQRTSTIGNVEALTYELQGHTFATWAFPGPKVTWSLDVASPAWAKRSRWRPVTGDELWHPRVHCTAFGKHLVGDRMTGTIAVMDPTVGTELDGTPIRRRRRAPGISTEHHRVPIDQFELLLDPGLGVVAGANENTDPQALLRVSVDGGQTFGNERRAGFGRIGEFRRRTYWTRLGAPPDAVVDVTWATSVPTRVVDAFVNNLEKVA